MSLCATTHKKKHHLHDIENLKSHVIEVTNVGMASQWNIYEFVTALETIVILNCQCIPVTRQACIT
jgi:hypothetical protein